MKHTQKTPIQNPWHEKPFAAIPYTWFDQLPDLPSAGKMVLFTLRRLCQQTGGVVYDNREKIASLASCDVKTVRKYIEVFVKLKLFRVDGKQLIPVKADSPLDTSLLNHEIAKSLQKRARPTCANAEEDEDEDEDDDDEDDDDEDDDDEDDDDEDDDDWEFDDDDCDPHKDGQNRQEERLRREREKRRKDPKEIARRIENIASEIEEEEGDDDEDDYDDDDWDLDEDDSEKEHSDDEKQDDCIESFDDPATDETRVRRPTPEELARVERIQRERDEEEEEIRERLKVKKPKKRRRKSKKKRKLSADDFENARPATVKEYEAHLDRTCPKLDRP